MTEPTEQTLALVAAATSVVALLLSLYNFIVDRLDKRPRIVYQTFYSMRVINGKLVPALVHKLANAGQQTQVIVGISIKAKDKSVPLLGWAKGSLPQELEHGQFVELLTSADEFHNEVIRLYGRTVVFRAQAVTSLDRRYSGNRQKSKSPEDVLKFFRDRVGK